MLELKKHAELKDYQEYIKALCKERGWDKNNPLEIFLLFSEEIGELAKAIRNTNGLYHEKNKAKKSDTKTELELEFADVFSYLLDLANCFDVDLEQAFRKKDALNSKRIWE